MPSAVAYTSLAGVYDELVVDPCFALWANFYDDLWQWDAAGVQTVLDVCCGTGLMTFELAQRGLRVVGVDGSADMLQRARVLLGDDVELHQAWLPDLAVDSVFDAVISTFDGLNYVESEVFAESVAAAARRLRPGGWFVFDLHTDAMMRLAQANPVLTGHTEVGDFVLTTTVDVEARSCRSAIEVSTTSGETVAEVHEQFFHSDAVVHSALAQAGFVAVAVFDEYTHRAVDPATTLRATWVARRG